jgi:hypothetical protein
MFSCEKSQSVQVEIPLPWPPVLGLSHKVPMLFTGDLRFESCFPVVSD